MKKIILVLFFLAITINCSAITYPKEVNLKRVGTITELKAINLASASNTSVFVTGFDEINDGGGGTFVWVNNSTATDNTGTIINPTGNTGAGRWIRQENGAPINPKWFGAKGNYVIGVTEYHDDTAAIQAAINYAGDGGHVKLPKSTGRYAITDTLKIGSYTYSGVEKQSYTTGWTRIYGLHLEGSGSPTDTVCQGLIWKGATQAGTNKITITHNTATYTYITDDKPMIHAVAANKLKISGLALYGESKAYSGITFEGNHVGVILERVNIYETKVGIINCYAWDLIGGVGYTGHMADTEVTAYVAATSNGGFQSDTHYYNNVYIFGCTSAAISVGSAQALNQVYQDCNFNACALGIALYGGYVHLIGSNFLTNTSYDLWHISGTSRIVCSDVHSEGNTSTIFYQGSTAGSLNLTLNDSGIAGAVRILAGGGSLYASNSTLSSLYLGTSPATISVDLTNCIINAFDVATRTTYLNKTFMNTRNCYFAGEPFTYAGSDDLRGTHSNIKWGNVGTIDPATFTFMIAPGLANASGAFFW